MMNILRSLLLFFVWLVTCTGYATEYELVTSANQLVAGCKYIIGSAKSGSAVFISNKASTYYRLLSEPVTIINNKVTLTSDIMTFTLNGSSKSYTFKTNNYENNQGFLSHTDDKNNYLIISPNNIFASFKIEISSTKGAIIGCIGNSSKTDYTIQYNNSPNYKRFSCYAKDSQSYVYLYKEVTNHNLTVSSVGYATLCLPFNATIPDGVSVYTAKHDGDLVTLTEIPEDVICANQGYIIHAPSGTYTFSLSSANATVPTNNELVGVVTPTKLEPDDETFIFANRNNVVGFYILNAPSTLGANKAYLKVSESGNNARKQQLRLQ